MLDDRHTATVAETLRASLTAAAAESADTARTQAFEQAAALLSEQDTNRPEPHPAMPAVGARTTTVYTVAEDDTAAAMGHPDEEIAVLGSPRLSLWFEVTSSTLLPTPGPPLSHVGVGILVHHLRPASVGEQVAVQATVDATAGRTITFRCTATSGSRTIALGTHQRVLREGR